MILYIAYIFVKSEMIEKYKEQNKSISWQHISKRTTDATLLDSLPVNTYEYLNMNNTKTGASWFQEAVRREGQWVRGIEMEACIWWLTRATKSLEQLHRTARRITSGPNNSALPNTEFSCILYVQSKRTLVKDKV